MNQLGGPSWEVKLGRKDSTTASLNDANTDLPAPFLDLNALIAAFSKKGFTPQEMVAMSGNIINSAFHLCVYFFICVCTSSKRPLAPLWASSFIESFFLFPSI